MLSLVTIEGVEMSLQGPSVNELCDVVQELLTLLKKLSTFVVATQDYKPTGT